MNFLIEVYQNILYFLHLTLNTEVLWVVFPLILATIIMLFYFERYKDEMPGWNTYVANSLVLLFISVISLRYIYGMGGDGTLNFISHTSKFIVSLFVLSIGIIILSMNFEHFLPEKIARHISSPLTLNLIAYVAVLYVFSELKEGLNVFISLFILFLLLVIILNLIRIPIRNLFWHIKKMKEKEKKEVIIAEAKNIEKEKEAIKKVEKNVKRQKKEIIKVEKEVKAKTIKELDKQKEEAIKLKKLVKK